MLEDLAPALDAELRAGDDRALWEDVAARVAEDIAGLDATETPPRHVTLALTRVPRKNAGIHPDAQATMRLTWERDRGGAWRFAGERTRVRRRRGSFEATVCIPAGTVSLAWVEALVLWRPHRPWTGPEDHETGRQVYRYRRDDGGTWRPAGVQEDRGP